jgi:hypothetical protein
MGLQTWKNAPKGKILKSDVMVAKNYLIENEKLVYCIYGKSLLSIRENILIWWKCNF